MIQHLVTLAILPFSSLQAAPLVDPFANGSLPPVSLEQQAALRCSAAFAIVSAGQERGNEAALAYPLLGERGKEYFVRSMAKVMEETGIGREQVSALVSKSAQELWDKDAIRDAMPSCLLLLDASGL